METIPFLAKLGIWLRWNAYVLGTAFVCFIGYAGYFGAPSCLRTVDTQIMQSKIEDLGQAMSDMQDFKTVVAMKLEKKK